MIDVSFGGASKKDYLLFKKSYYGIELLTKMNTVESLLTDTPRKGHYIKYLSTMDKTKSPNFIPPINIMRLETLKEDKPLEFILVPKCPLFRDSTIDTIRRKK